MFEICSYLAYRNMQGEIGMSIERTNRPFFKTVFVDRMSRYFT